jgi:RNA polymerase sigma factor (sigma-70 family)
VARLLDKLAGDPAAHDTDSRLLERFAKGRDEAAFETLMRRHGPMVLGVCRRVLDDADSADDAFQATFLVLARKADTIRKRPSVGSWLFGVAFRTSLKARVRAVRRRTHERAIMPPTTTDPHEEIVWRELRPLLDAELDRLPEKYRAPLVLCYLEGKTNEEAARHLGWTKGTVSGRLARARDVLRQRLVRRGLDLTAGALAVVLSQNASTAAVPAPLFQTTLLCAAGHTAPASAAASLSEGVLHMMTFSRVKTLALVLVVAIGFCAAGLVWAYQPVGQGAGSGPKQEVTTRTVRGAELLGTWQVVAVKTPGENVPDKAELEKSRWVFAKDKVTMRMGGESRDASYKTDPSKKPALLDLTILNGPENERKTFKTIYSLQGDELKICLGDPEADRPKDFNADGKTIVFTLKRLSNVQVDKGPRPPDQAPPPKTRAEQYRLIDLERAKAVRAEAAVRVQVLQQRLKQAQAELDAAESQLRIVDANLRKLQEDAAPDAAVRRQSAQNLKKIGIAMHNYHDTNTQGRLPALAIFGQNGRPQLSWRVAILPFLDQDTLYQLFRLDEPWDSDHNKKLLDNMPAVFRSPAAKGKQPTTPYQVFIGKGAPFHGNAGPRLTQFADGTSNTIMVVESARPVPWTKPEELLFDANHDMPKLGGIARDGFQALMADGAVRFFPNATDADTLRAAITHAGGENFGWDKEGRPTLKR